MSLSERNAHFERVAAIGCIVCRVFADKKNVPATIHHVRTKADRKRDDTRVIPLCPEHHQYGPHAVHKGKQAFEAKFAPQEMLLDFTRRLIRET